MDDLRNLQVKLSSLKRQLASILPPEDIESPRGSAAALIVPSDPHSAPMESSMVDESVGVDLKKLGCEDLLAEVTYVRLTIDALKWVDGCTPQVLANPKNHLKCVYVSFTFPWSKQSPHFGQIITGVPKQMLAKVILWNFRWVQSLEMTVELLDLWKQSDLQIKVFHRAHLTNAPEILGTATIPVANLLEIPFELDEEVALMSPVSSKKRGDLKISLRLGSRFDWFNQMISAWKKDPVSRESIKFTSSALNRTFTTAPTTAEAFCPAEFQPSTQRSAENAKLPEELRRSPSPVPQQFHIDTNRSASVSPVNEKEIEKYLSFREQPISVPKVTYSQECQTDISLLVDGVYEFKLVDSHVSTVATSSSAAGKSPLKDSSTRSPIKDGPQATSSIICPSGLTSLPSDRSSTSVFSAVSSINSPPTADTGRESRPNSGKNRRNTVASRLFPTAFNDTSTIVSVISFYHSKPLRHSGKFSVAFVDSEGISHCSSVVSPDATGNLVVWRWRRSAVITSDRTTLALKIFVTASEDGVEETKLMGVANVPLQREIGGEQMSLSPELTVEVLDMAEMQFNGFVTVQLQFPFDKRLRSTVEEVTLEHLLPSV